MDLRHPFGVVTPSVDGDVLAVLAHADKAFSGRAVQRAISGTSQRTVLRALRRLEDQGIVQSQPAAPAILFRLNRRHLAAPMIEALASLRLQLIERLRETIESWELAPLVAVLFGSAARGDASEESDLDILLVRARGVDADDDGWRAQVAALEEAATAWTGNDARALEYGEEELPSLVGSERVIEDAVREGILLYGSMAVLKPRRTRPM